MPDIPLNPVTPISNGGLVGASNPLPVTVVGGLTGLNILGARTFELSEQPNPAAPAPNTALVYVRDNGAGKTQLVVRFATGAVRVIATEP